MQSAMSVAFWGVRGTVPSPGASTVRYGGNTPCVEVRCGEQRIVLDAGTGLRPLGDHLMQSASAIDVDIFLSHCHIDHINGLPEIMDYRPAKTIYAGKAFFEDKRLTTKFLRDELKQIVEINNIRQKPGSAGIKVLWPTPEVQEDNSISDNDKSLVMLI